MARSLLVRGMLVGLLAGLLMFTFGKVFGEPSVDRAIAFEAAIGAAKAQSAHDQAIRDHATPGHDHAAAGHAHGHALASTADEPEPELFSRDTQSGIGLLTGVVIYSTAFGGLFALVFAYAFGRIGTARPQAVAALLAAAGFLAISVVPMIIYPPNPPAIGEADTIAHRTALYFIMISISVAATVGAIVLRTMLVERTDAWTATLSALGAYVAVIIAAAIILPAIDEVPSNFPATTLWHFRLASMGLQLIMWSTFGVAFGFAAERLLAPQRYTGLSGRMSTLIR